MERLIFITVALGFCGAVLEAVGVSLGRPALGSAGRYLMAPCCVSVAFMSAAVVSGTALQLIDRLRGKPWT